MSAIPSDKMLIKREIAIIKLLRKSSPDMPLSVKEIWEEVKAELGDDVTVQAYHKLMNRLTAIGKVEVVDDGSSMLRYKYAPHLDASNPATLDELDDWEASLSPPEFIARTVDAIDYFEEKKSTTLKEAAKALLDEDPRKLFYEMIVDHQVVVFIDSCFWHGCPQHLRMPKSNLDYWTRKIARNVERDAKTNADYKRSGWKLMRFWEHELKENFDGCVSKIEKTVRSRASMSKASSKKEHKQEMRK